MNLYTKQKWIHRHRKQIYGYQREKRVGRDKLALWDQKIYFTIYEIDKQQGLNSTGNYSQYFTIIYKGKESENNFYIYIYIYTYG